MSGRVDAATSAFEIMGYPWFMYTLQRYVCFFEKIHCGAMYFLEGMGLRAAGRSNAFALGIWILVLWAFALLEAMMPNVKDELLALRH